MKWKRMILVSLFGAILLLGCATTPPSQNLPPNWAVATLLQTSETTMERIGRIPLVIQESNGDKVIQYAIVTDGNGLAMGPLLGIGTGEGPLSPDYQIIFVDETGEEAGRMPGIAHVIVPVPFVEIEGKTLKLEATK